MSEAAWEKRLEREAAEMALAEASRHLDAAGGDVDGAVALAAEDGMSGETLESYRDFLVHARDLLDDRWATGDSSAMRGRTRMATEEAVVKQALHRGEEIVFVQRGAVANGALDPRTGQLIPIHKFNKGWLAVTSDQGVIDGSFGIFGCAKLASAFRFTAWRRDPHGVAFVNTALGPVDSCGFIPKTIAPSALHGYLESWFGDLEVDSPSNA